MRVSCLLSVFAAALCCSNAHGSYLESYCALSAPVENVVGTQILRVDGVEIIYQGRGQLSATLSLDALISSLWVQNQEHILNELPKDEKGDHRKGMKEATELRTYSIFVREDGTYGEQVGLADPHAKWWDGKPKSYLTGDEAKSYLKDTVFTNEALRPLLFSFDFLQRLVSPARLLSTTFDQIFDLQNKNYKKKDEQGSTRFYFFNTTDTPKRYADEKIDNLFTRLPETKHSFEKSMVNRSRMHARTPVAHIRAATQQTRHANGIHSWLAPVQVQLFSTQHPHALPYPHAQDKQRKFELEDLVMQVDCTKSQWDPVGKNW